MFAEITRKTALLTGAAIILFAGGGAFAQDDHSGHDHAPAPAAVDLKPGDPVVAVVNGKDIKRSEVQAMIEDLPPQMKQMPLQQVFPMIQEQFIANKVIDARVAAAKFETNPEVLAKLAQVKEQIIRGTYVENEIKKAMTDERMREAYKKGFGEEVEETRARHILVDTEEKAKEIIKKLDGGASFEDLAKQNSTDPGSGAEGGDLGYFTKDQMVPEFSEAAFKLKAGAYTKTPVKSQFGWHVIKTEDRRKKEPPKFEDVKPQLEQQLRNEVVMDLLKKWQEEAKVKKFDINGEPVADKK